MSDSLYSEKKSDYFANARREIAPLLPERVGRVLEVGCGSGATMAWLRSVRDVVYAAGVEITTDAAAQAASAFDMVITGSIETVDLPFEAGSFDLILVLDVLEHLVDPWVVVQRLHGLLGPQGAMIASIPNVAHYSVALPLLLRGRWDYAADGLLDRTHLRFFVERTAVELMTSSGLAFDMIERNRSVPRWIRGWPVLISRWPKVLLGRYIRWYVAKILPRLPASHLVHFQFLIRVRSPGKQIDDGQFEG